MCRRGDVVLEGVRVVLRGLVVLEGVRVVLRGLVVLEGVRVVLRGLVVRRVLLEVERVCVRCPWLGRVVEEGRVPEEDRPRDELAPRFDEDALFEADVLFEAAGLTLLALELDEALDRLTCVGPLLSAGTLKLNAATKETNINWYFKRDMAFTL